MRLTVGPLPPSVYWRRRALVLGVVGLIVLGIVYAASAKPNPGTGPNLSSSHSSTPAGTSTVSPTPTAFTLPVSTITAGPFVSSPGSVPPGTGPCADGEILLTAEGSPENPQVGAPVSLTLTIKNISTRACIRNTGSIPQELRLRNADGVIVWSSDDCSGDGGYDYSQPFTPGFEKSYTITWDGYRSRDNYGTKTCVGPRVRPGPGSYQIIARLGTLYSAPATLTIQSGS
jgi:hypothetical protein